MSHRKQVRLAGSVLDRSRHVCAFFHHKPPDEFLRELRERTGQSSRGGG
jgi:hypothetical protein